MPHEDSFTDEQESSNPPHSELLNEDFFESAPTDQGVEVLAKWLQNHIRPEVYKVVKAKRLKQALLAGIDTNLLPIIQTFIDETVNEQAAENASILEVYASLSRNLHYWQNFQFDVSVTFDDDQHEQEERNRVRQAVEELQLRKKGVSEALFAQGLLPEQIVIDALFKRADVIPIKSEVADKVFVLSHDRL